MRYAIDPTTGRPGTNKAKFKTGKELYNVEIESIPTMQIKEALRKLLVNKYKARSKRYEDVKV